ncbi:MAG: DUF952 domain-containing protein [Bacteroidota bacterium]
MNQIIYHITDKKYFEAQLISSQYISPTFLQEKFIHLSTESQVNNTLQNYYLGIENLILLHIDSKKLGSNLKYEQASNGEYFPHCYAPISIKAILKIEKLNTPQLGIATWNY